ncbi:MAG: glycosyltransferase family 4 protein [Nanoarchaeota archaeon]|nr:glycosyltransferase family 4 protein [Nanoarchaeota archaeon]
MLGWEFPPFNEGGLGTACYGLTKGLSKKNIDVTFVLPKKIDIKPEFLNKIIFANIKLKYIDSLLQAYITPNQYNEGVGKSGNVYGKDLFHEVYRYAQKVREIAKKEDFDIIHAHDWMTYEAGYFAKQETNKPLIVHIHATEDDRTGGNPNEFIAKREEWGLKVADRVIANSNYTKQNVIKSYQIDPKKIDVVHWGLDLDEEAYNINHKSPFRDEKTILFLGRVTIQKGPDYFVEVAKKVLDFEKGIKFVVAGSGDMLSRIINRVSELGILDKFIFTGWLRGEEVHKAFQMADIYLMPSVSEPFGLVALESLKNKTPIIVSKQSGVSEVINNALKVDFWDINEMTNQIVNCLRYPSLLNELKENGFNEVNLLNLDVPAQKCINIYNQVLEVR